MHNELSRAAQEYLQRHVMPNEIIMTHTRHDTPMIDTRIITEHETQNTEIIF